MDSAVVVMGSHLSGALVRAVVLAWSHLSEVRSRTNGPRCGASGFRSFATALVGQHSCWLAGDYFFRVNCMAALSKDMPGAAK